MVSLLLKYPIHWPIRFLDLLGSCCLVAWMGLQQRPITFIFEWPNVFLPFESAFIHYPPRLNTMNDSWADREIECSPLLCNQELDVAISYQNTANSARRRESNWHSSFVIRKILCRRRSRSLRYLTIPLLSIPLANSRIPPMSICLFPWPCGCCMQRGYFLLLL